MNITEAEVRQALEALEMADMSVEGARKDDLIAAAIATLKEALARIEQDEALMQQVLEALRSATYTSPEAGQRGGEAVTALRARLEKKYGH